MQTSPPDAPHSARNLSSGEIAITRRVSLDASTRCTSASWFDPTARASTVPSEETVANMVPCVDRAKPVVTQSLCGDSTTLKSHRRMVLSRDADAKNEPSGEN